MANEPASSRRSLSPESSEDAPSNDKAYRKYASGVERALTLFETALQEWADYISFLNRLLRALQARHNSITTVPSKATIAKRLAQCLNPSLPSGVHQKALEVYNYVFTTIGQDGLARDLPLYLPGLASTLSFASLSVRAPYLDILETHFLRLDPRSLRPAMKSIVLALLPGLEEETSEDFDRTMKLMENFKVAIRSPGSEELTDVHSTGDDFFWQCFFLASITSHSRRGGALAYLVRTLPKLGEPISSAPPKDDGTNNGDQADLFIQLGRIVTSPEPGLLLRCFAAGLADEQLLIQRGFLDLLVTHLPLHSKVLQTRVKPADLELLLRAASGVVIRRDMSLNRRLWAWFLGPDPPAADNESTVESPLSVEHPQSYLTSKTSYFEDHGLHSLTQALLAMIQASSDASPTERARPYRICLSLMDRWEIGGLVVPEVFLPIVDSVRQYKSQSSNKNDFNEVFKSASVFFDGVESGLIYGEMVSLLAQAIGPSSLSTAQRLDKLDLVTFILANFNIREEEMITIHAPLTALSILCMLEDAQDRQNNPDQATLRLEAVTERILEIALSLFDLIPDRAFPTQDKPARTMEAAVLVSLPVIELLKRIKAFYVNDQGSLDAANAPFTPVETTFRDAHSVASDEWNAPESTLISLLNALEQVLARGHERLLAEEARTQVVKGPDQQQGFFGNMVSGVFASDGSHSRSVTANDRLTVHLAFQDAVRICFTIWSWGQGADVRAQDITSVSSFNYTSLRMRNRARRLLEHLFAAETLECLETAIGIWRASIEVSAVAQQSEVFKLLPALDGSRPRHTIPAIFNAIYSRTNPQALDPARRSTLTISLQDTDLVTFLVEYARSLEDDAMDEIWQDCMAFLRDLLANPFPHRQTLPSLLEFAAILGEKVDNTNFGEQRKMRRELGDLFLRLLTAIFTTKPMSFAETASDKGDKSRDISRRTTMNSLDRAEDVVAILASIVPTLPKVLVENDRVLSAAGTIAANVIGPAFRAKGFPETVTHSTLELLQELARLPNNQKTWKKDVGDAFNDGRFFGTGLPLVRSEWLPLLRQWTLSDKDRMPDILARISPPTTAGIVFGVGATSARLEADRKTQLNLRRVATLVLAASEDTFVSDLPTILEKVVELLGATSTSSPSSSTRSDIFMVVRALVLKTSAIHLAMMWPIINAELHSAISSVVAPDHSSASETYNNISILQACKLLDLLICVAPDDFQLHEWLFITDTIDAVYRASNYQPVALVDELSEELGQVAANSAFHNESAAHLAASSSHRRPLLGAGGIKDEVTIDRKDELVAKILRPFFGQLSIFAFESTYAMAPLDLEFCIEGLLKDVFDERTIVRAL
ncbi:hypothetical protein ACHAQG_006218 [Verticillium nonalfalfae]